MESLSFDSLQTWIAGIVPIAAILIRLWLTSRKIDLKISTKIDGEKCLIIVENIANASTSISNIHWIVGHDKYIYEQFFCDTCNVKLPLKIKKDEKRTIEIPLKDENYLCINMVGGYIKRKSSWIDKMAFIMREHKSKTLEIQVDTKFGKSFTAMADETLLKKINENHNK